MGETRAARRVWGRLERRAIAAHERETLAALRELAAEERSLAGVLISRAGLGSVQIGVADRQLILAGISATVSSTLAVQAAAGTLRLTEVGRYGKAWWIAVADGANTLVVLASRVRLLPAQGGIGVAPQLSLAS